MYASAQAITLPHWRCYCETHICIILAGLHADNMARGEGQTEIVPSAGGGGKVYFSKSRGGGKS